LGHRPEVVITKVDGINNEFRITVIEIKFTVGDVIAGTIDHFGIDIATSSLRESELARVPR
jgi:hypothetical protein